MKNNDLPSRHILPEKFCRCSSLIKKVLIFLKFFRVELIMVLLFWLLTNVLFTRAIVPTSSMVPTIRPYSIIVETGRLHSRFSASNVKRGDIISFSHEESDHILVKRVIGIPGDIISFCGGDVYVNGEPLEEDYCLEPHSTYCSSIFFVPNDSVFCLGDNRMRSKDSRLWNDPFVPFGNIESKTLFALKMPNFLEPLYDYKLKN